MPRLIPGPDRWATPLLLAAIVVAIASCASRWVPYETVDLQTSGVPDVATLEALADHAEALGYPTFRDDIPDGSFRVRSPTLRGTSYFRVAVAEDGVLIVLPEGGYVRNNGTVMHTKFRDKLLAFAAELQAVLE